MASSNLCDFLGAIPPELQGLFHTLPSFLPSQILVSWWSMYLTIYLSASWVLCMWRNKTKQQQQWRPLEKNGDGARTMCIMAGECVCVRESKKVKALAQME